MAAERKGRRTGLIALLLGWGILLAGLGALAAWLFTRPPDPASHSREQFAYQEVLPEAIDEPTHQSDRTGSETADSDTAETGSGQERALEQTADGQDLTRPPELREGTQSAPRVQDAPLIAVGGDETQPVQDSEPPPELPAIPESSAIPEAQEAEIQEEIAETEESGETAVEETGSAEVQESVLAEESAAILEGGETEQDAGTQTNGAADRQQPAFAPPQASPGLPPPPIPGRSLSGDDEEVGAQDAEATTSSEEEGEPPQPDESTETGESEQEVTAPSNRSQAWQRYAQPFAPQADQPMIAIVVTGLGLSEAATETAIRQLPAEITLSFSPYARRLDEWIALARSQGHEVLLDLPMEPEGFPADDPGPQAILTELGPQENAERLQWVLSRGSAYLGVAGTGGGGFTPGRGAIDLLFERLAQDGLVFLGNPAEGHQAMRESAQLAKLPLLFSDRTLDQQAASRSVIDAGLSAIERTALSEGEAVAVARPYPVSLERLQAWSEQLPERGVQLAPLSALLRQ
ncbi:divergent polysaccharide deacetylase family protein [Fodinicurvata sediminis]|uniref:divergent polysaccharide deacetylase family protein n=1 Tax=Fodinicurvata sediminis TaxID=1121832 RepID=UPI0003B3245A|nr:divergent polysaccharide deacetylase family protein [Fodinicurvata sediminis]